jgi:hypothetical protein
MIHGSREPRDLQKPQSPTCSCPSESLQLAAARTTAWESARHTAS